MSGKERQKKTCSKHGAPRSQEGFTLLELMVVIVILGILIGLVAPQFMDEPHKARVIKAKMQMESIETALKKYYLDNGYYPSTEQGLNALVSVPSSGRIPKSYPENGYMSEIPDDPWEGDYIYISPGNDRPFDLISYGADGKEGGEGQDEDVSLGTKSSD